MIAFMRDGTRVFVLSAAYNMVGGTQ
jgi:hypothetical protein